MENTITCWLAYYFEKGHDKQMETKKSIDMSNKADWGVFQVFQRKSHLAFSFSEIFNYVNAEKARK